MMPTSALALDFDSAVAQTASYTEPVIDPDWEWAVNDADYRDLIAYYDSETSTLYIGTEDLDGSCFLSDLKNLNLDGAENATVLQIKPGVKTFQGGRVLSVFPKLETVYIPASVQEISDNCFWNDNNGAQSGLSEVYIAPGSKLSSLGANAFENTSLKELDLHDTEIEALSNYNTGSMGPFGNMGSKAPELTIRLPRNLAAIDQSFFQGCQSLTDLYVYHSDEFENITWAPYSGNVSYPTWSNVTVHCVDMTQEEIDNPAEGTLIAALKENGAQFELETTSDPEPAPGVGDGEGDEGNKTDPGTTTPETPATPTTPTVPSNPSTSDTVTGGLALEVR